MSKKIDLYTYGLSNAHTASTYEEIVAFIISRLPDTQGQHYSTLWVRRNGKDERYEMDWLGKAQRALAAAKECEP